MKIINEYIFEKLNSSAKTLLMDAQKYLDHTDRYGVPILSPRESHELYYIFKDLVKKIHIAIKFSLNRNYKVIKE